MASALKFSTTLRNQLADSFGGSFDSGTMAIYSGAPPADPQTAPTGVLLATINLPADAFAAAVTGVIAKNGAWSASVASSGTAGWFRLANSGGTIKVDGTAGVAGDTPDAVLDNKVLVAGGTVTVNTFTLTQPE